MKSANWQDIVMLRAFILMNLQLKPQFQKTGIYSQILGIICALADIDIVTIEAIVN